MSVLEALLKSGNFIVTALTRVGSSATVPAPVKVVEVDYDSVEILTAALKDKMPLSVPWVWEQMPQLITNLSTLLLPQKLSALSPASLV